MIWLLRYGPKCSQPIGLQHLKPTVSLEQIDKKPNFLHVAPDLLKLKAD